MFFRFISLLRYRFFIFAGILPYILGLAVASYHGSAYNVTHFILGLVGMVLAFAGVEFFNEYFEPNNRLFFEKGVQRYSYKLWMGVLCFILALPIGIYLTIKTGILVIVLALIGFMIAFFYVGPPLRLIYRGFGEIAIFLAYGPLIVLGSYYIQSLALDTRVIFISLIPGTLILSLAILNQIPDYYQDMIIGKRNFVVRLGKEMGSILYIFVLFFSYGLVCLLVSIKVLPWLSILSLLSLPLALKASLVVWKYHEEPAKLLPAINNTAISYVFINTILFAVLFLHRS